MADPKSPTKNSDSPDMFSKLRDIIGSMKSPGINLIPYSGPLPATFNVLGRNPIIAMLGLLGTSTSLNSGEDEWLKKNKVTGPINEELLSKLYDLSGN